MHFLRHAFPAARRGPGIATARRLVIGVGNPGRGDDAVGRVVARSLRDRVDADVEIREHDGEATTLLERLEQADAVWLIDASVSGAAPGTVRRLDAGDGPLPPARRSVSSHGFGPAEAVELARVMQSLPATCILFLVEGQGFEAGRPLSQAVEAAAREVAERIAVELANDRDTAPTARSGHRQ